jgi:hypothetical protein
MLVTGKGTKSAAGDADSPEKKLTMFEAQDAHNIRHDESMILVFAGAHQT